MARYATFSATFKVEDYELLKKKYMETDLYKLERDEYGEDHQFLSSTAILELLIGVNDKASRDIGVEFYASACDLDTEEERRNASNADLVYGRTY
jgi:hypothetical protein